MKNISKKETHFPIIALAICICFSYLLPFRFHPFAAFYNDALVIFGVAIAFLLIGGGGAVNISRPWIAILPFGLAIIIAVQSVLLGNLGAGWDILLPVGYFMIAGLAVVLGASLAAEKNGSSSLCTALAWAFLSAGLVSVAIEIIQIFSLESAFSPFILPIKHGVKIITRPFANLGQPNHLALLLCFAVASIWYLYQFSRLTAGFAIAFTLSLLCGLVLTQSRIGWIVIPAFSCLVLIFGRQPELKKIPVWLVVGLFLIYVLLVMGLSPIISFLVGLPTQSAAERVGAAGQSERLILFQEAIQISSTYPWFGAGWYEFGPQQVMIGADFPPSGYSRYAHNIVLSFAAELGWPITFFVFGALIYWGYLNFFARKINKEVGFSLMFFIPICIHSMVEFPLWYAYVLIPTSLIMGMVHQEQLGTKKILVPRIFPAVLFIILSACLVGVSNDYRRVVAGYQALNLELMGLRFKDSATTKPAFTIFPKFYDYFQFAKAEAIDDKSQKEIYAMERISRQFGFASVLMDMSLNYALNNRQNDTIRTMATIQKLHSCSYDKFYRIWREKADLEPAKFASMVMQFPKPDSSMCRQ